ncbi:MAG: plastocyanin/azurin family copper-binding protein [Chloroflexota bacterium]|nr:plastocyanin/azurin family copper-binding protein [Chloroflexota bacterium]
MRVAAMMVAVLVTSACASSTAPAASTARPVPSVSARPATATPTATATADDKTVLVQLGEHFFDPSAIKVKVGTTVTWRNNGQQTHDLHAYDGSFNSPPLGPGNTFTFTFTKPGLFRYYCLPHEGDGMTGQVQVE